MASHSSEECSQRGKRPLTIDLNYPAPCEELVLNTRSTWANSQQGQDEGHGRLAPQTSNDCEVIDEDIAFISPVIYAQSKNSSRRNLEVRDVVATNTEMHSGHSDWGAQIPQIPLHCHKRKRTLRNQAVLNWELHFSSEDGDKNKIEEVPSPELPESTPPQEIPSFSCPICLGPLSEETSTKCGHIFCKMCIEASIKVQHKCPTCRKKLRMKDTIRVYLPTK
ncbi:E3 ubiquitin-protein ligase BRE1-like [Rosa sericea]